LSLLFNCDSYKNSQKKKDSRGKGTWTGPEEVPDSMLGKKMIL